MVNETLGISRVGAGVTQQEWQESEGLTEC